MARVLMFHKPRGLVVTRFDERGRRTVYDALPQWVEAHGFRPIGRLDMDSRGLLLFTDDGHVAEAISRPGRHAKIYEVWVRGVLQPSDTRAALSGVQTAQGPMKLDGIELRGGAGGKSRLLVTLHEGRNRQIRRVLGALKDTRTGRPLKVTDLKRLSVGPITLDIPSGQWRELSPSEVHALCPELKPEAPTAPPVQD